MLSSIFGGVRILSKLVCGIVSTVLAVISWIVFWWLSIVAVMVGIVGLILNKDPVDINESNSRNVAGTVLNVIGIAVGAIGLIIFIAAVL